MIELGPLPDGKVAELVGDLVGGNPGQQLAEFVGQAGGNPLYARELADGLVREGQVKLAAGRRSWRISRRTGMCRFR